MSALRPRVPYPLGELTGELRTFMLRLQQQQMLLRSKLDRWHEDGLSGATPDDLWTSKSAELQVELRRGRGEMERHENASQAYETAGLQILELAERPITCDGALLLREIHASLIRAMA